MSFPVDALEGTGPGLVFKHFKSVFHEGAIKASVVGHDQVRTFHHVFDFFFIQSLTLHVLRRDARELDNLGGNRTTWVFEVFIDFNLTHGFAGLHVHVHSQHGQLNDAFCAPIKARCLGVQDQHALGGATRARTKIQNGHQASLDFEVGVRRQLIGHVIKIHRELTGCVKDLILPDETSHRPNRHFG